MEERYQPNAFELIAQSGPWGLLVAAFSVATALWLLISRVRGCFRVQPNRTARDLAFLITAPVTATLYLLMDASVAVQGFMEGGIDAEFGLLYGLRGPVVIGANALLCFVSGVIALCLPSKRKVDTA